MPSLSSPTPSCSPTPRATSVTPAATSAASAASDLLSSPATKTQVSGSTSDPWGSLNDLINVEVGSVPRGSMSRSPPVPSVVDSVFDSLGGGVSSGPASSNGAAAAGSTGGGAAPVGTRDVDVFGLFEAESAPSASPGGASPATVSPLGGSVDDLLGDFLGSGGGGGRRGAPCTSSSSLHASVLETVNSGSPAVQSGASSVSAAEAMGGEFEGAIGSIGDAVARAQERATARSPPSAPVTDGFAGFEDFVSLAGGSDHVKTGASGGLNSLEDLLSASTIGGGGVRTRAAGVAAGGGMSLGDDLDAVFGKAPAPRVNQDSSGGAAVIDDMFGTPMGAAGGAGLMTAQGMATHDEFSYQAESDDEVLEGDTEQRREARQRRRERVRARIAAKVQETRDRDAAVIAEQHERQTLKDLIGADIDAWIKTNQGNVRTMLANLADVLWEGHGYRSPSMNDLVNPTAVRKSYHKALLVIHPDKVKQRGGPSDQVYIADRVFDQVRDAFKAMEAKEL